jgi:magnesium transporter
LSRASPKLKQLEVAMITILNTTENKLRDLPQVADGAWVNVINPTDMEIEETYGLGIPLNFITDSLNSAERPRIKKEAGTTLILLRIPYRAGKKNTIPFSTVPLGIILCYDDIITVCKYDVPFLKQLLRKNGQYFTINNRDRIILRILTAAIKQYTKAIDSIKLNEGNIDFQNSKELLDKSMKANRKVIERIQKGLLAESYSEEAILI